MTDINTDQLIAYKEVTVADPDGTFTTVPPQAAFLGLFSEFMLKQANRVDTASATLISGATAATVALGAVGITGKYQGLNFAISATGALSANPTTGLVPDAINTTGTEIRKIGVALSLGDISAVTSSLASGIGTLAFVLGSAFTTGESLASLGNEAFFSSVPTPKFSPQLIPVGIIHIPNTFTSGDPLSNNMLTYDVREVKGYDFTKIIGTPTQP